MRKAAEIDFARRTGFLEKDLISLWLEERRRRRGGRKYGIEGGKLSYDVFLEMFLTSFRLAFILRDERINYPYRELGDDDIERYWKENRDLFTRYNGDSFGKDEVEDIIAKRIREEEYEKNVEEILLLLSSSPR